MSKVSCSYCGRIHDRNYECIAKSKAKANKRLRDSKRIDNSIYNNSKWRKLRDDILDEYNNIDLFSYYVKGRIVSADCVHHIHEVIGDTEQAYEWDNLITLSNYVHRKIIHKLYKTKHKEQVQSMLKDMIDDWNKDNRKLESYKIRFNNIIDEIH
ncbi:HNH endonuclease [Clostridium cagae]|uniref:HNH endonuclease n=1 Tax=Clostridium cagae TaxID=2080751 RepID=UPI003F77537F